MNSSSESMVHLFCPGHRTILAEGMKAMLLDGYKTDITIRGAAGSSVSAHQLVLSLFAPAFRHCFTTNSDKEIDVLELTNLKQLMEFVYSGRLNVQRSQLPALLEAAHRLGVDRLVRAIRATSDSVRHRRKRRCAVPRKTSAKHYDHPDDELVDSRGTDEVTPSHSDEDDCDEASVMVAKAATRSGHEPTRSGRRGCRQTRRTTVTSSSSTPVSSSCCPHCDYRAPSGKRRYLFVHLARAHQLDVAGQPLRERFSCGDCGDTFFFGKDLRLHALSAHANEKPYRCSECSYATVHKGSLTIHVNIVHRNIRQYVCELCGHRSAHLSAFKCHKRSHTGEKPYSCAQCQAAGKIKRYSDRYNYKLHLKKHENDEKAFLCHLCSHTTRRRDNLRSHLARVHNAELPA